MRSQKKVARAIQNHRKVCDRVRDFKHVSGGLVGLPKTITAARREVFSFITYTIFTRKNKHFSAE